MNPFLNPSFGGSTPVLRLYQQSAVDSLRVSFRGGNKRVILCGPTGSGKTVMGSKIIADAASKESGPCVIVHRRELMHQWAESLRMFGVNPVCITSESKRYPTGEAYIALVETLWNRCKTDDLWMEGHGIRFLTVDECHDSTHYKIIDRYGSIKVLGLSATPVASKTKEPLNSRYQDMVITASHEELIQTGALAPAITYSINSKLKGLKKSGRDFSAASQKQAFENANIVNGAYENYILRCKGKRALCFNIDVEHSKWVCDRFNRGGIPSVHVDGTTSGEIRDAAAEDLARGRILVGHNVGIWTTGYDETSLECIILNLSTTSLVKKVQMEGRGARPHTFDDGTTKEKFTIIDMGRNWARHGIYGSEIPWMDIFRNPGEAHTVSEKRITRAMRLCRECRSVMERERVECLICGHVHSKEQMRFFKREVMTAKEVTEADRNELKETLPAHLRGRKTLSMNTVELREYAQHMGYKPGWVWSQINLKKKYKRF